MLTLERDVVGFQVVNYRIGQPIDLSMRDFLHGYLRWQCSTTEPTA